ncbi:Ribonuclease P/MRP protein subunit RPP1 [Fasciola gigantica]|uniref:Ribonuclease P/MRP protein subunit RPP1 n=1 Tax=Fasciola gigantica TaxID=46835 RepID=A0A504Y6H4_FASGI|nr:Ribonuclease P/MRP protein subunit RPP1 [Fasciola gigantica]
MENRVYDLDIPVSSFNSRLLARVLDSGYHCIAVSHSVNIDDFNFNLKSGEASLRKKTKEERQNMRSSLMSQLKPTSTEKLDKCLEESHAFRATIQPPAAGFTPRIFRRITLYCEDPSLTGLFFREFGEMLNAYDVVSLIPLTSDALSYAIEQTPAIDIITIDYTKTSDLRITSKQCSTLLSHGLHLELQVNPVLRPGQAGTSARSNFAHLITNLLTVTRPSFKKALVFSSGVTNGWEVRRPIAVASILTCLGVYPEEVVHHALTRGPCAVLTHGLWRSRTAHGASALLRLLPMPCVLSIREAKELDGVNEEVPAKKQKL